jgi:hypothetical protein
MLGVEGLPAVPIYWKKHRYSPREVIHASYTAKNPLALRRSTGLSPNLELIVNPGVGSHPEGRG